MDEVTTGCRVCGKPYKIYSMMVGDQSACPDCRRAAERAVRRDSNEQEHRRRREFYGDER